MNSYRHGLLVHALGEVASTLCSNSGTGYTSREVATDKLSFFPAQSALCGSICCGNGSNYSHDVSSLLGADTMQAGFAACGMSAGCWWARTACGCPSAATRAWP